MREVARVIVADSPSSDATAARAAGAGADVIRFERGYGRACMAGVIAAPEADIIVFMDGDGADDPARQIQARSLEDLPRQLMSTDQITANELKPCLLQNNSARISVAFLRCAPVGGACGVRRGCVALVHCRK